MAVSEISVEYTPETGVYSTTYDYEKNPPSVVIPMAMTMILGVDVPDLDRVEEVTPIDLEAVDRLFAPTPAGTARGAGQVEFTYLDHIVRIFSSGRIEIQPRDEGEPQG